MAGGARNTEPTTAACDRERGGDGRQRRQASSKAPDADEPRQVDPVQEADGAAGPLRGAEAEQPGPDAAAGPGEEEADEDTKRLLFLAKAFYEMEERVPRKQERVRAELAAKGYVEVDDEWVKRRAEAHAVFDREWPKIQAKLDAMILEDEEFARQQRDSKASTRTTVAATTTRRKRTR